MFNSQNKKINNREPYKIWFWSMLMVFFFCLFSYGYFVRGAIVNIVQRQNMEKELSSLNTKVLTLESEYIKAKNDISMEKALAMGFIPASSQKFVTKNVIKGQGLSLVTPRI